LSAPITNGTFSCTAIPPTAGSFSLHLLSSFVRATSAIIPFATRDHFSSPPPRFLFPHFPVTPYPFLSPETLLCTSFFVDPVVFLECQARRQSFTRPTCRSTGLLLLFSFLDHPPSCVKETAFFNLRLPCSASLFASTSLRSVPVSFFLTVEDPSFIALCLSRTHFRQIMDSSLFFYLSCDSFDLAFLFLDCWQSLYVFLIGKVPQSPFDSLPFCVSH